MVECLLVTGGVKLGGVKSIDSLLGFLGGVISMSGLDFGGVSGSSMDWETDLSFFTGGVTGGLIGAGGS